MFITGDVEKEGFVLALEDVRSSEDNWRGHLARREEDSRPTFASLTFLGLLVSDLSFV